MGFVGTTTFSASDTNCADALTAHVARWNTEGGWSNYTGLVSGEQPARATTSRGFSGVTHTWVGNRSRAKGEFSDLYTNIAHSVEYYFVTEDPGSFGDIWFDVDSIGISTNQMFMFDSAGLASTNQRTSGYVSQGSDSPASSWGCGGVTNETAGYFSGGLSEAGAIAVKNLAPILTWEFSHSGQ